MMSDEEKAFAKKQEIREWSETIRQALSLAMLHKSQLRCQIDRREQIIPALYYQGLQIDLGDKIVEINIDIRRKK